jgi:hypothetical protein
MNDKMARYEGASQFETIEMLTGLRHREGERSEGISTGAASPALIKGDVGITILTDRDNRANFDRKKKLKVADEYVCTDCGTLESPEWRKGPSGPKTLCNACGCEYPPPSSASISVHPLTPCLQCAGLRKRRNGMALVVLATRLRICPSKRPTAERARRLLRQAWATYRDGVSVMKTIYI